MKTSLVLLCSLLFASCMTTQKATSFLERKGQLPGICADRYPVVDSQGATIIQYRPAANVDRTAQLDSLKTIFDQQLQAFNTAKAGHAKDTPCLRTIQSLQMRYESLQAAYEKLHASYKPCKPDTAFIDHNIYHDTNPAKTADLTQRLTITQDKYEAAQDKAARRGKLMWGTWILIALVGGGYFFLKGRTALIMSIVNKAKNIV